MAENKDNFVNIVIGNKWRFSAYFVLVCLITFTFLYLLGWVPTSLKTENKESFSMIWDRVVNGTSTAVRTNNLGEVPVRVEADSVGVDTIIYNPNTTDVATLDDYLLRGAVRYPGSGLAGNGNIYLFGHSTGFRVVNNQAFKTFNGLKNLKSGDEIKIYSTSNNLYLYKVTNVRLAEASDVTVRFDTGKNMLTMSTCNSFGSKEERYVVEAELQN
ncbi:MAG: sortase [bacterium]